MNLKNNGPVTSSEEKVHELVAEFHRCEDQGNPVSPKDFMARHPEHADTLQSYFDGVKAVDSMTGPPPQEHTFISADSKAVANDQTVIENSASIEGSRRVSADAPPTRFGRYKILKELGRGAMGAVYLAQDEQLDRKVALKIPQFGGALNSGLLERFYREARAAGNLRHPGICPVYDVGEIGGQHYITMAYIEGRPLRDFSKSSKRQADKQTARVIRKIALAMAEAHAQNVIHRDLKPANIMIDTKNEPVVMDFGLARRAAENEEKLTHTGTVIGTPAYMSPEQVDGDNENVGPPADIYSLGVVFYELLTGELPFKGNLMSILKQISMKQPRPPIELHADVDPFLQDLCLKMLEKRAADRPKSMAEVAKSLSEWLQGLHAPTDESGMLETSRVPGRSKKKKAGAIESTDPVTVPGFHRLEPQPEEFPAFADLPSIDSAELSGTTMTPIRLPAGFGKHPPGNRKWLLFGGLGGAAILLARIVFFFTLGGKYDVQITLDDPSMSLQVDGEAVVIEGNGSPIRLSAGEHTLHVEMNGFESETDSFTVKKDGKNALHVARLDEKKKLQIHVGGKPTVPAGTVLSTAEKNAGLPDSGRVASATVTAPPLASPPTAKAPFDAAQARTHQEAWARHMGTTVETTNSVGAKMILIPPGEFLMGSTNEQVAAALKLADEVKADQLIKDGIQNAERPQHKVVITKPFLMSSTEVTIGEFKKFVEASRYVTEAEKYGSGDSASEVSNDKTQENLPQKNWRAPGHVVTDDSPAGQITWNDAVAYCRWLSTQEKTTYRLPTEAEWEYACRAGTTTQYSFGDDAAKLGLYGWYDKNAPDNSHPVGTKLPNGFGLFDMHGNVLEWCGDSYEEKWYEQSAGIDPSGPSRSSSRHVLRGGYWRHNASVCRSAYRDHNVPSYRRFNLGFRYVRVLDVPASVAPAVPVKSIANSVKPATGDVSALKLDPNGRIEIPNGVPNVPQSPARTVELLPWIDWLGPKLKGNEINGNGWVREGDAITMERTRQGTEVLPESTRNGAVRATYLLRNSKGIQFTAREHKTGETRDFKYFAEDNGEKIQIAKFLQGGASYTKLAEQVVPASISKTAPRTLEFRLVGETLTLTLNDSVTLTIKDAQRSEGLFAVVATKDVLIQKVEVQRLDDSSPNSGDESAWQSLFNGKDLSGWKVLGVQGWTVENGVLLGKTTTGSNGWLMSEREFTDFELELEYKLSPGSNSGIFLRAWPEGDLSGKEFREIQLLDDEYSGFAALAPNMKSGSLFKLAAPNPIPKVPPNEWHRVRVRLQGQQLQLTINDVDVLKHTLTDLRPSGCIGLQLYPSKVEFRNLRVRSLDAAATTVGSNVTSDRSAAEWAIAQGGEVTVTGRTGEVASVNELPMSEFKLLYIKFVRRLSGDAANLVPLRELNHLEGIRLDGCRATAAGIAGLAGLPKLQRVSCGGAELTDDQIAALGRLTNIRKLFLTGVKLTPQRLATLAKTLPQLESLNLMSNSLLDDAALESLGELKNLQLVQLQSTSVSAAGVATLKKAVPNCQIEWDGASTAAPSDKAPAK